MTKPRILTKAVRALACVLALSTTMLCAAPRSGWAMLAPADVAGTPVQASAARAADVQAVEAVLRSPAVHGRLGSIGLDDKEVRSRLDKLSDREVRQLASRLEALNPGGDGGFVIGLLVVAVLVLLIVYLVKRV